MLPLLRIAVDNKDHTGHEAVSVLAEQFKLSATDQQKRLPSGKQTVFTNRVAWARSHLKQAGLIESPKRGSFRITRRGLDVLADPPDALNMAFLKRFPEYQAFRNRSRDKTDSDNSTEAVSESASIVRETPREALANAYRQLRAELEAELLEQIKQMSPLFFERLVIDLLVGMGYGGNRQDAGRAIGRSNDEGIDGIINEDRLGLDVIYIQAKRWENTVSRPEIQKFAGALQGMRARKGVFLTTSDFSKSAREYARQIDSRLVLIDGNQLAGLMIDYNVGVSTVETYEIKQVDSDYFIED